MFRSDKIPCVPADQIDDFTKASVSKYVTGKGRIYFCKVTRTEQEKEVGQRDENIDKDKKEKPKLPKVSYTF